MLQFKSKYGDFAQKYNKQNFPPMLFKLAIEKDQINGHKFKTKK